LALGWDKLAKYMSWNPGYRSIIDLSPVEAQSLADKYGYGQPTGMPGVKAPGGVVGGVSVGPSGVGTTGPSATPGPKVENPDMPSFEDTNPWGGVPSAESFGGGWGMSQDPGVNTSSMGLGEAVGIVGGDSPSDSTGGKSDTGGVGEGMGGHSGSDTWAKGGVGTFGRRTRITVGERPEKGIFIPKAMEAKGIQPRELIVLRGLLQALKRLGG